MTSTNPDPIFVQEAFPPPPICWPCLGADDEAEALRQLRHWVDWLTGRYGLDHRTVPACWAEHGGLVEELSALHDVWVASYDQTATPLAPLGWHANFAAARQGLTDWVARAGCRPNEHRFLALSPFPLQPPESQGRRGLGV
jgi:hypothetical protein